MAIAILFNTIIFDKPVSAAIINGWYQSGSTWYYYENGLKVTNEWRSDSHGWCYLGEDGSLVVNQWIMDSNGWCRVGADGYWTGERLLTDPQSSDNSNSRVYIGWVHKENNWYFYQPDGTPAKGWIIWNGKYYYLYSDGKMAANTITPDGYMVGRDGAWDGKESKNVYYENIVNSNDCSSKTGYYIYISLTDHVLCIFTGSKYNWKASNIFLCTVGAAETPTITGHYTIGAKGPYFITDYNLMCKYYTQIYGNYLIHSILYYPDGRIADERLGMNLSHGCIRVATENAKYIYDNIPSGTAIWIVK